VYYNVIRNRFRDHIEVREHENGVREHSVRLYPCMGDERFNFDEQCSLSHTKVVRSLQSRNLKSGIRDPCFKGVLCYKVARAVVACERRGK